VSRIVLEGGTDIAEMVLFSADELPSAGYSEDALCGLADRNQAIRMPTGGDGGYLLHLYVDEEIPDEIRQYFVEDDTLKSEFRTISGQVAFGGAESTFTKFQPNPNIRADTSIPPGSYDAVAYHTDFPEDLLEDAVENAIGADGMRVLDFSTNIIIGTVGLTIAAFFLGGFFARSLALVGAAAAVIGGILWYRSYTRTGEYKRLDAKYNEVQYEFPSIVIQLARQGS